MLCPELIPTIRSGLIHADDTKTKQLGSDLYEVGQQEVRQLVQHCAALTTRLRCSCYAICGRPPPLQHILAQCCIRIRPAPVITMKLSSSPCFHYSFLAANK